MTEYYEKLKPVDDFPEIVNLEGVHDDFEGFRIIVRGSDSNRDVYRISFDSPLLYRSVYEGDMLVPIAGNIELSKWWFFRVHNSELAQWFNKCSNDLHKETYVHYGLYMSNFFVDVLSKSEPKIDKLTC